MFSKLNPLLRTARKAVFKGIFCPFGDRASPSSTPKPPAFSNHYKGANVPYSRYPWPKSPSLIFRFLRRIPTNTASQPKSANLENLGVYCPIADRASPSNNPIPKNTVKITPKAQKCRKSVIGDQKRQNFTVYMWYVCIYPVFPPFFRFFRQGGLRVNLQFIAPNLK